MNFKIFLVLVLGVGFFVAGGFALGYATNYGIALGQHACLVDVQHSADTALISKIEQRAKDQLNKAQALRLVSWLGAIFGGIGFIILIRQKEPEGPLASNCKHSKETFCSAC